MVVLLVICCPVSRVTAQNERPAFPLLAESFKWVPFVLGLCKFLVGRLLIDYIVTVLSCKPNLFPFVCIPATGGMLQCLRLVSRKVGNPPKR